MIKTKRNKSKYPALDPTLNLKTRYEEIEIDYLDKLSDKEKEWLNNFNEEYVNTNFSHPGERIHPKTMVKKRIKKTGKYRDVDLEKQEREKHNNDRNSCVFTKAKASGNNVYFEDMKSNDLYLDKVEDYLVHHIDEHATKLDDAKNKRNKKS